MNASLVVNFKKLKHYPVTIIVLFIFFILNNSVQAENFLSTNIQADYMLLEKSSKRLTLFSDEKVLKSYRVALGRNPEGPKLVKGDKRTPEGRYIIDSRNPDSKYHLSLHISYPNEIDREIAGIAGVSSGGNIMIHGIGDEYAWMGKFHAVLNWTDGCIAVTNEEIEEIWRLVPDGTAIEIRP
ncbi:L,D-transpeptidase catalytic domain [bacterium BMS3Abin06]|nr:L,D-transpeptidase catalytic domain [bacterium BMS3Abin06]